MRGKTSANTAPTFEHRADLPDSKTPQAGELPKRQLQEEERDATENQHDEVGQHEGTCRQTTGRQTI